MINHKNGFKVRPFSGQKYKPLPVTLHGRNNVVLSSESFNYKDQGAAAYAAFNNATINYTDRQEPDNSALEFGSKRNSKA